MLSFSTIGELFYCASGSEHGKSDYSIHNPSNCSESVTVDYSNPVLITIPNTGLKTAKCQYSIQMVDSNLTQTGYPITGYFSMLILIS